MDRVLQNTGTDIQVTFYDATGVAADATGTPTVTITRADGTVVVSNAATTKVTPGTGIYKYTVTPAQTATLDNLQASWSGVIAGTTQTFLTYVDVVGGFLFGLVDLDAQLQSPSSYTAVQKIAIRTLAEDAFEEACGVAFVPRYARETIATPIGTVLLTAWPRLRKVRSATVAGTALSSSDLTALLVSRAGEVTRSTVWQASMASDSQTTIAYEHGYDRPPARVSQAVLRLAKTWLVKGPVDDRATQIATDVGTINLFTPGIRGAVFGIPEVDQVADMYCERFGIT